MLRKLLIRTKRKELIEKIKSKSPNPDQRTVIKNFNKLFNLKDRCGSIEFGSRLKLKSSSGRNINLPEEIA